jgi:hypothetical protein
VVEKRKAASEFRKVAAKGMASGAVDLTAAAMESGPIDLTD